MPNRTDGSTNTQRKRKNFHQAHIYQDHGNASIKIPHKSASRIDTNRPYLNFHSRQSATGNRAPGTNQDAAKLMKNKDFLQKKSDLAAFKEQKCTAKIALRGNNTAPKTLSGPIGKHRSRAIPVAEWRLSSSQAL